LNPNRNFFRPLKNNQFEFLYYTSLIFEKYRLIPQSLTSNKIGHAQQLEIRNKILSQCSKVTAEYFFLIQRGREVGKMLDQNNVGVKVIEGDIHLK